MTTKKNNKNNMKKRMMDKKAYMRTIEATIAVVISFVFILFIVSNQQISQDNKPTIRLFSILKENPEFRDCVINENYSCLNTSINTHYPDFAKVYTFRINVTTESNSIPAGLPDKDVHLETMFISGNNTYTSPQTVRVYYWLKN